MGGAEAGARRVQVLALRGELAGPAGERRGAGAPRGATASPRGSFQDSVCFHDYLRHMERDVCRLAYGLIAGDTKEKVGADHRWAPGYIDMTFDKLQSKMEEYWEI